MDERKQRITAVLACSGFALLVFGFFAMGLLLTGGIARFQYSRGTDASMVLSSGVGLVMMIVGGLLIVWAVVYGIIAAKSGKNKRIYRYPNCLVLSRFAVSPTGDNVYDVFDGPDDDLKYYVHLKMPDGKNEEFRCVYDVFLFCGEGMRGEAVAQGTWLSQFVPYIGSGIASQPPGTI